MAWAQFPISKYIVYNTDSYPPDQNEDADHRYLMFSASFNKECRKLAENYLSKDHVRIRISRPGSVVKHIRQNVIEMTLLLDA